MKIERLIGEPDKETISTEYCDYLLYLALKSIKDTTPEKRSIVVAGIYDSQTNNFYIASSRNVSPENSYGKWNHAEYEAMALAVENGADLSKTIAISSLGPCVIEGKNRAHQSCTELLTGAGIKKVHVGVLDNRQADVVLYNSLGLDVSVSNDQNLIQICDGLNNYFNPVKEERLLGLDKAGYIEEILSSLPEEWSNN